MKAHNKSTLILFDLVTSGMRDNNEKGMNKTSTDQSYHHGDLRHTIIEAACEHLRTSGADTLSLRALARKVGVSQTAPYRHFDSKSALFAAIAKYGFNLLEIDLRKAREQYSNEVEEALVQTGLAYIYWALANPEKYQLFFDSSLVEFNHNKDLIEAGTACFAYLVSIIEQGIDEDVFIDKPTDLLAGSLWANIHGITSLLISKSDVSELGIESPIVGVIEQLKKNPRDTLELILKSICKD
ncbi:MAG: AcrR family transcriptional regulator [Candidatus Azotimanducaceae bacterium]|jgi:AcrR family transcriptional regulator